MNELGKVFNILLEIDKRKNPEKYQPERSKREDSPVEFSKEFIDKQNEISLISMLLG